MAEKNKKFKTIDIVYIGLFAALIAVCSWISLPIGPIPFTLQTMAICITAGLLGTKRGTLSVLIYILIGAIGVPVFSSFKSGIGVIFGATGGYIIGFIFTALIVGFAVKKLGKKLWVYLLFMTIGVLVCYLFGTLWFMFIYNRGNENAMTFGSVLGMCVIPFLIPDAVKIIVSSVLCLKLNKFVK